MTYEQAQIQADIFKALAHPIRILLLDALVTEDLCVNDLMAVAEVDQSNISRHLSKLKQAGLITDRRVGARTVYHLQCPCILQAIACTTDVLNSTAERQQKILRGVFT